jgi:hypothetical protein
MSQMRILLGHLASFGDCLYATAVARQIKHDYPGCHLTWAVGSLYRGAIDGNPDVDTIWEIPLPARDRMDPTWRSFEADARRRVRRGEFDRAFFTQIGPRHYENFDGTVRASIFHGYPGPITVPVRPVFRLTDAEVAATRAFADRHRLAERTHVILFECAAESRQSFVTPAFAATVARQLTTQRDDTAVILSSHERVREADTAVIDGSTLTLRQNAELSRHCTLLVGCSSGISWLCTSDWAKRLPTVQLLRRETYVLASMTHDAEHFGLPTEHIIEMTDCSEEHVVSCITAILSGPFADARGKFHEQIPVRLDYYLEVYMRAVLRQFQPWKVVQSLFHVFRRYGCRPFFRYCRDKLVH